MTNQTLTVSMAEIQEMKKQIAVLTKSNEEMKKSLDNLKQVPEIQKQVAQLKKTSERSSCY